MLDIGALPELLAITGLLPHKHDKRILSDDGMPKLHTWEHDIDKEL